MSDTSIEARIAALEGRVGDLERQRWEGPPRLGPKTPSQEEVTKQIVDFVRLDLEFCPRCGSGPRQKADTEECPDCGYRWSGPRLADLIEKPEPARDGKGQVMCTTNGKPVEEVRACQTNETGQHDGYIVLCPDERAKGFVRPYRDAYKQRRAEHLRAARWP